MKKNRSLDALRMTDEQLSLFPAEPDELCRQIGLNWLSLVELWEQGLLSFEPRHGQELSPSQEAEVLFLGNLVCAGCDLRMLGLLLKSLGKPYAYNAKDIYYDWASRQWKPLPEVPEPEVVADKYLDGLIENEDIESLKEIAERVSSALKNLESRE
ncbi:MAG: hypothetical protein D6720_09705 [Gammaproteobacteria bacterium]|nr:MAG: hypothetical protein D6720_09705 [Gammaproteobacteria bacterium]